MKFSIDALIFACVPDEIFANFPKNNNLEPFPQSLGIIYSGHRDIITSISPDPSGQWLASGSIDGTVLIWEILTGKCMHVWDFKAQVQNVAWCPVTSSSVIATAVSKEIHLFSPKEEVNRTFIHEALRFETNDKNQGGVCSWHICPYALRGLTISQKLCFKTVTWHHLGDCLASVGTDNRSQSVILHEITRKTSFAIFKALDTKIIRVIFHPSKPLIFMATEKEILIHDLIKKGIVRKLFSNCCSLTSLAIHPLGHHLITGSEDKKVCWYDLDFSHKPCRVLKYHTTPVRAIAFHATEPLFASVADDGSCQVFHGMVPQDFKHDPLLIPVKILLGHELIDYRGLTDCAFHPTQPWIFTSGVDGKCILFCN